MEPANNDASNSVYHDDEVPDYHLEKIERDFNEFKRTKCASCSDAHAMTLEDLIDMYITSGRVSSPVDFNESESTLPQHQAQTAHVQSTDSFNIDIEFQLTDEMTEGTSQNDTRNFPDSSPTVNTNFHVGAEGSNSRVTRIRYGDQGVADHIIGGCSAKTVFDSVMKSFKTPGKGRKNLLRKVHVKGNGKGTSSRKYIKRRYKQIIETNEDIDHQTEITNVKNREVGAKARAKKQAHEAYIRSQLSELHQKNERLRNLVTFLEGCKENNLHPEPLRRAISVPQQISFMDIYE